MLDTSRKRKADESENSCEEKEIKENKKNTDHNKIKPQSEASNDHNNQRNSKEEENKPEFSIPKKLEIFSSNGVTHAGTEIKLQLKREDEHNTQRNLIEEKVKHGISAFNKFNLTPMKNENYIAGKTERLNNAEHAGNTAHGVNHTVESRIAEMGRRCFSPTASYSVRGNTYAVKDDDFRFQATLDVDDDVEIIEIPQETIIVDDNDSSECEFISCTSAPEQITPAATIKLSAISRLNDILQTFLTESSAPITAPTNANSLAAVGIVNTTSVALPQLGASSPSALAQTDLAAILAAMNDAPVTFNNTSIPNQKSNLNTPLFGMVLNPEQGVFHTAPNPQTQANKTTPDEATQSNDDKDEIKCPICFEVLGKGPVVSTKCGHIFCSKCIKAVMEKAGPKSCPKCRRLLRKNGYHFLYL